MRVTSFGVLRSGVPAAVKKVKPPVVKPSQPSSTRSTPLICCRAAPTSAPQSGREQTVLQFEYFEGVSGWFKSPYVEANLPDVSSSDVEDFMPLRRVRTFLDAVHDRDSYMGSMDGHSFDWGDLPVDPSPHDTVDLNDMPMQHARRLFEGVF